MRIRHLNHSSYRLHYHIVWGTEYRRKWLKEYIVFELKKCFKDIIRKYPTLHLENLVTDKNHIYLQIEIHQNLAILNVVQKLKSNSSKYLQKNLNLLEKYLEEDGIWSIGFLVSSVGIDEHQVKRYLEIQNSKDMPQTATLF